MKECDQVQRSEVITRMAKLLRESGIKKTIKIPRHRFHITDDEGTTKDFYARESDKEIPYTVEDVATILEAFETVIQEALKNGEEVNMRGFGIFYLAHLATRVVTNVENGEKVIADSRYIPKFRAGVPMKRCGRIYQARLANKEFPPVFGDETEEFGNDDDFYDDYFNDDDGGDD